MEFLQFFFLINNCKNRGFVIIGVIFIRGNGKNFIEMEVVNIIGFFILEYQLVKKELLDCLVVNFDYEENLRCFCLMGIGRNVYGMSEFQGIIIWCIYLVNLFGYE